MPRMKIAALLAGLLVLGGCEPAVQETAKSTDAPGKDAAEAGAPYTISLAAQGGERVLVLGAADGRRAAAIIDGSRDGKLVDVDQAQARFASLLPDEALREPEVLLKLPAFSLQVDGADGAGAQGDGDAGGRVKIQMSTGKQTISIDAQDGQDAGAKDQAVIRIDGADEKALRDFLNEQEGISDKLRIALLSELGLE